MPVRVAAAVFNNAVWCDGICRALGCRTAFDDGLWINRDPSPRFYPNAITLTPDGAMQHVRPIVEPGVPVGWALKDSFGTLELATFGFAVLFDAEWLLLPADQVLGGVEIPGLRWERATTDTALAAWERAWRGAPLDAAADQPDMPRVFAAPLVDDPDIVLLSGYSDAGIASVVAANRSDDGTGPVAGISNLVLTQGADERYRAAAVAAVRSTFPDLPLVCYERGPDLDAMVAMGF